MRPSRQPPAAAIVRDRARQITLTPYADGRPGLDIEIDALSMLNRRRGQ